MTCVFTIIKVMKHPVRLVITIVGCELVGILGGLFTAPAIRTWYAYLAKPSFSPPNWIFGPVWTVLYFLMGIAAYLIWTRSGTKKKVQTALRIFIAQLTFNFLWSILFFGLRSPLLALIDIFILWALIVWTMKSFHPLSKTAAYLLVPYLVWVSFATVLNWAIVMLN